MKVSAYFVLYRDFELLSHSIDAIYDLVDEIILVDGAYDWVVEFYGGLHVTEPASSSIGLVQFRGRPLLWAPKVKYIYRSWKDEYEKRQAGYEAASGDLVIPLDMDDLVTIDPEALDAFMASSARVASLTFVNLIRSYASMHEPASKLGEILPPERSRIQRVFKRKETSAEEHLDFLWQLYRATPGGPIDASAIFARPVGRLDHLTLVRGRRGLLSKYLFYRAGHWREEKTNDPILLAGKWETYRRMLEEVSVEEYEELFLRLAPDSLRVPEHRVIRPFRTEDRRLTEIAAPFDSPQTDLALPAEGALAIPGIKMYAYVPGGGKRLIVRAEGIFSARIHDHPMLYDADNRRGTVLRSASTEWDVWECDLPHVDEERLFARLIGFEPIRGRGKLGRLLEVRTE